MAVPVRAELLAQTADLGARAVRSLARRLERARLELRSAAGRMPRREALLQLPRQRLDLAAQRFSGALGKALQRKRGRFMEVSARLRPSALKRDLAAKTVEARRLAERLAPAMRRRIEAVRRRFETQGRVLETLSYEGVLRRGFALVSDEEGRLVRSSAGASPGEFVRIRFADGEMGARVDDGPDGAQEGASAQAPSSALKKPRAVRKKTASAQGDLF